MVPIFEQGHGNGIGHSYEQFLNRFIEICESHINNKRAKSFAFILYDFQDRAIKKILKTDGGFAKLDRLSDSDLSIFYIHSTDRTIVNSFNQIFLGAFEIDEKFDLPFVLFFKIIDEDVKDVEVVELNQNNLIFAFAELYSTIENYIDKNIKPKRARLALNRLRAFSKSVGKIAIEVLVAKVIEKSL